MSRLRLWLITRLVGQTPILANVELHGGLVRADSRIYIVRGIHAWDVRMQWPGLGESTIRGQVER